MPWRLEKGGAQAENPEWVSIVTSGSATGATLLSRGENWAEGRGGGDVMLESMLRSGIG